MTGLVLAILGMYIGGGMVLLTATATWQWALGGFWLGCAVMASIIEWAENHG